MPGPTPPTMSLLRTLECGNCALNAVTVLPDLWQVISAPSSGALQVWDSRTEETVRTLKGQTLPVNAAAITPESGQAISASDGSTFMVRAGERAVLRNPYRREVSASLHDFA
jgi:WD40 repeat protein